MQVTSGVRLGPYEVIDRLGAGGMGEVWRARDTRLERGVALKVLPPGFAGNEQLRLRLEREARSISQLSHPNICALFDVGRHEGIDYLVMELLDGETLAERLRRGALPIGEVLRIGAQIADALSAAHGKGLVHRDLKPANIMLAKSGAKLLDFGLAREWVPPSTNDGNENASTSIELTHKKALTGEGMIVGTYQYMAPEQLEGLPADARTDLFAFGAVLYEMATGTRAFDGKNRTSVIAAIIDRDPPPISAIQPLTPPALEHVVRRCLAKDPEQRWQSARDVSAEIRWIAGSSSEAQPMARRRRNLLPIAVLLLVAAVAAVAALYFRRDPVSPRVTSSILAPAGQSFAFDNGSMVLSPDGTKLLYVGRAGKEAPRICIRDMGTGEIRWLAGTEDALFPFWSPDGSRVGFFAASKLKTMAIAGGAAEVLAEAPHPTSGAWGADGTILFVASRNLMRIPASGAGEARMVRKDTGGFWPNHPFLLPDGKRFLYRRQNAISNDPRSGLYLASFDSDEDRQLMRSDSNAVYLPGWILHWDKGRLRAVGFDISKGQLTGESFTVAADVQFNPGNGAAHFSVSQNGRLVYRGGTTIFNSRLTWLGRDGKELGAVGAADNYYGPRISPDGRWVAVDISDSENNGDLWLLGIERPLKTRVSSHPADESAATWSRDGKELYYMRANPTGGTSIYRRAVGGETAEELVLASDSPNFPMDISPDGTRLIFDRVTAPRRNLFVVGLPKGQARPLLATHAQTLNGNFSPDGRHLLYVSDDSGQNEVYVRPLSTASADKWQVSNGGGSQPRWRRDGREIFYVAPDGMFTSVPVAPGGTFAPQTPQPLFPVVIKWNPSIAYDVAPDGNRFLVNVVVEEASATSITFVQNWLSNRQ